MAPTERCSPRRSNTIVSWTQGLRANRAAVAREPTRTERRVSGNAAWRARSTGVSCNRSPMAPGFTRRMFAGRATCRGSPIGAAPPVLQFPQFQVAEEVVQPDQRGEGETVEPITVSAVPHVSSQEPLHRDEEELVEAEFPPVGEILLRVDGAVPVELLHEQGDVPVGVMNDGVREGMHRAGGLIPLVHP